MTKALNRLPAILLAVIIAAALSLAIGLAQPSYAANDDYFIIVSPVNDEYIGLPGGHIDVEAEVYDSQGNEVTGYAENAAWSISSGRDFATVEGEGPNACVKFGELPEGIDEHEIGVQVVMNIFGKSYKSYETTLTIDNDFALLRTDPISPYLRVNRSAEMNAQFLHFTVLHPEGELIEDASYSWDYDKDRVQVTPEQATGGAQKFEVKRLLNEFEVMFLDVKGTVIDAYGNQNNVEDTNVYYLEELTMDLNDFEAEAGGDWWNVQIKEGDKYTPTVTVKRGEYVLPENEYDLIVERYEGLNEETGEPIYKEYPSLDLKTWEKDKIIDDEEVGGTAFYRIKAVAKLGSDFTGQTDENPAYVFLYSENTFNGYNATIELPEEYGKFVDVYPYWRYEVTPGTVLNPVIKINNKELTENDYDLWYCNIHTGDSTQTFPTEIGEYNMFIEGKGAYYGDDDRTYIKVGEKNSISVKTKTVTAKSKKKTTIAAKKAFRVKTNGKVYYWKQSGNSKISISQKGKITVKKGLKKGKTYKVKVEVSTPGDANHLSATKTVTLKIKVK